MKIGEKVNELIEKRGFIKAQIARRMGITSQALNGMLKRDNIDSKTLQKISQITEIPIYSFFDGVQEIILNEPSTDYKTKKDA